VRVLLDENLDRRLKRHFDADFEVVTVTERGWSGKRNGELLQAAEAEFEALVTMDRGVGYQQNLSTLGLGIVLISARSNRRQDVEPAMPAVNAALRTLQPGQLVRVAA
jgi:predicted nuclease of predicted toxin-antitoxin system